MSKVPLELTSSLMQEKSDQFADLLVAVDAKLDVADRKARAEILCALFYLAGSYAMTIGVSREGVLTAMVDPTMMGFDDAKDQNAERVLEPAPPATVQ